MTDGRSDSQFSARRAGARILNFPEFQDATEEDFGKGRTVIFIHGFTADALYMRKLMKQFAGAGFKVFAFEYPSDRGIDVAARTLRGLLKAYDANNSISTDGITLVCHSMGGLVARALINIENGAQFVRKIITLGTPHDGTLKDAHVLRLFLSWVSSYQSLIPTHSHLDRCPPSS